MPSPIFRLSERYLGDAGIVRLVAFAPLHRAPMAFVPLIIRWGATRRATSCAVAHNALRAATKARRSSIPAGSISASGFSRFR
jgi:hypothetical protein